MIVLLLQSKSKGKSRFAPAGTAEEGDEEDTPASRKLSCCTPFIDFAADCAEGLQKQISLLLMCSHVKLCLKISCCMIFSACLFDLVQRP